jgi:hypothetical protein
MFGIINVSFDIPAQLLIRFSAFVRYWRKDEYNETVHRLFIDFHIGKHLPERFPIQNDPKKKKETLYRNCFSTLLQNMPLGKFGKTRWD